MPSDAPPPASRPPRRPRYRGTHPRRFEEKYKELRPAAHPEEIAKVRARGQTPAGSHVPVLLEEVLAVLRPAPGQTIIDCTLGRGGHAEALAGRIGPTGRVIGLDIDARELEKTATRLGEKGLAIATQHLNFAGIGKALAGAGLEGADIVLADLGLSSMQIDDPTRGFSFKRAGPLDMRMDPSRGPTAEEWLRRADLETIRDALERFGDEPDAASVAQELRSLVERHPGPLRTHHLTLAVLRAKGLPERYRAASPQDTHPAARAFQALRIAVNRELENLAQLLRSLPYVLAPGGRAAVISFHSGEDSLVAASFAAGLAGGLYSAAPAEPIRPSPAEVRANPRARSARLRWAERSSS
jgi:16S rRNA (cytosine1402-N4)-methyltransferase